MRSLWGACVVVALMSGVVGAQVITPLPSGYKDKDDEHKKFRELATAYVVQTLLPLCPAEHKDTFCVQDEKHAPISVWHKDGKTLLVHILMQGFDYAATAELDAAVGKLGKQFAGAHNKNFIIVYSVTNSGRGYGEPAKAAGTELTTLKLFIPQKLPPDPSGQKAFLRAK
jgi:hypothetical protein